MTFAVQTSIAYDTSGRRDPDRDEWFLDDVGIIPADALESFKKNRYANAVQVIQLTPEKVDAPK